VGGVLLSPKREIALSYARRILVLNDEFLDTMQGVNLAGNIRVGTRFLKELLFEVGPTDPTTFAAAALVLIGTAMAAACIPARRAMKVDPMAALRHE